MESDKGFWLALEETTRRLRAGFNACALPPQRADIEAAVTAAGWTVDALDEYHVEAFLRQCRDAKEAFEAVIGHVIDGAFTLVLTEDHMSVTLDLTPPRGGTKVQASDILQALTERGIVFGLRLDALHAAVDAGHGKGVIVAAGIAPEPGTPASFQSLLDTLRSPTLATDDEDTWVDYRNMGQLLVVQPGVPLMRRIPAVQGKSGINVLHAPVPAPLVADTQFAAHLTGVVCDEADPCLLRAAIAGSPILLPQGVCVNPIVEVEAVDLASGNINFDGTLRVKGDVTAGMRIQVAGDVFIHGTMEAATVEAGGNVVVKGGIIGSSENIRDVLHSAGRVAHITCSGSLQARFIVNAIVNAGQNVMVSSEILASDIAAGHSVVVGPPKGRRGNITGGRVRASHFVSAATLGSPAGTPTRIQAGMNMQANAHQLTLANMREQLLEEKEKLEQLLNLFRLHPEKTTPDMAERAQHTHAKITADLQAIDTQQTQFKALQPTLPATIEARHCLHCGVMLHIGGKIMEIMEDRAGGRVRVEHNHIVIQ